MRTRSAVLLLATVALAGCDPTATSPTGPVESPPASAPAVAVALAQPSEAVAMPGAAARAQVTAFIERLAVAPDDPVALTGLGYAAYQLARETADPTEYARAEEAFSTVLAMDPVNLDALLGMGTIALAKHDFAGALTLGEQARAVAPRSARVYGVLGDALVELGRYDEAKHVVQTMVDLRPDLGSYARVSYQRELHGDLPGAIAAMESAITAGGPATENTGYLRVVLGNLWFTTGDLERASAAYEAALARDPGYVFATAGLARVSAARGDMDAAIAGWQAAADRVPFPEFLIGLGETQEAAGRAADAQATYGLVRDIQGLFTANGVRTDLDLALFEADHGDPAWALELGRAAWAETPNVKAADALAWALHQAGQDEEAWSMAQTALRLGSLEPAYAYHAGVIAAALGDREAARTWLSASVVWNVDWSPLHAPRAAVALAEVSR